MIHLPEPALTDGRVRLRPPTGADVPAIVAACQDPAIRDFTRVPYPYTRQDARRFVSQAVDDLASARGVHLAVTDRAGQLMGVVGVTIDRSDLSGEVGYWVAPAARGTGVATAAVRLLCRLGFDDLGLQRLTLYASAENPASNAVARRLGFVHEGTLRQAGTAGPSGDPHAPRCDMRVYGLLPGELR